MTLLFGVPVYEQVAEAYIAGLEERAENEGDVARIASVASFFVSRIDTLADALLEQPRGRGGTSSQGKIAIANAKVAYERYKQIFSGERWERSRVEGRANAATALGEHEHEEPRLP